ncbi:hypothetical protein HPB50_027342 [Hyalomma asiaticum]|uniref:Uncharacterized protein n=1 Tax=Hyalomma asiaticum TaxID=266040 RepID=A0ACB7TEG1_HYAAI|nr:hypothetical protein HPB50_027342 [Hyalomma asiaticum]
MHVAHYVVQLPPYSHPHSDILFLQVEASFKAAHVTSQRTCHAYPLAALPGDVAPQTPESKDTLKAAIPESTVLSERRRLRELISTTKLGDRPPSQLLRHMHHLLGWTTGHLFLRRFQPSVQMVLLGVSDRSLSALASLADKLREVPSPNLVTFQVAVTDSDNARAQPATSRSFPNQHATTLILDRKRPSGALAATSGSRGKPSRLFCVVGSVPPTRRLSLRGLLLSRHVHCRLRSSSLSSVCILPSALSSPMFPFFTLFILQLFALLLAELSDIYRTDIRHSCPASPLGPRRQHRNRLTSILASPSHRTMAALRKRHRLPFKRSVSHVVKHVGKLAKPGAGHPSAALASCSDWSGPSCTRIDEREGDISNGLFRTYG